MSAVATLRIRASDVSGQKQAEVEDLPADFTVGELLGSLVQELSLPSNDASGRPLRYQIRLEREARHLRDSECVGDALQEDDEVVLAPNVDAA